MNEFRLENQGFTHQLDLQLLLVSLLLEVVDLALVEQLTRLAGTHLLVIVIWVRLHAEQDLILHVRRPRIKLANTILFFFGRHDIAPILLQQRIFLKVDICHGIDTLSPKNRIFLSIQLC